MDRHAITPEQAQCLTELISRPTLYYQRCVEEVSFSDTGGQCWVRSLQIKVPETASPQGRAWRVISLGDYRRRRFPDFAVENSEGERLNLLTRSQHGWVLADALMTQNLYEDLLGLTRRQRKALKKDEVRSLTANLKTALYDFLTTAGDIPEDERSEQATNFALQYAAILRALDLDASVPRLDKFVSVLLDTMKGTRYLCWVEAEPGEVLNLRVTYTVKDPMHQEDRSFLQEVSAFWRAIRRPGGKPMAVVDEWFQKFGLAPMPYRFKTPSSQHNVSYYFTMKPPRNSHVSYLSWGSDDAFGDAREVDCSFPSAHVHSDHDLSQKRGKTLRAYVRSAPHHHKQVLGVTILNLVLVWLLLSGLVRGPVDSSGQSILLLTPTVFLAYLAQGQRHYYAGAHRPQRAILWAYLFISITFVVAVSFSPYEGSGPQGLGPIATVVAGLLAVGSAIVCAWNLPLGPRWERVLRKRQEKACAKDEERQAQEPTTSERSEIYDVVVRRYSFWVLASMVAAGAIAALLILFSLHGIAEESPSTLPWEPQPRLLKHDLGSQPGSRPSARAHSAARDTTPAN